MENHSTKIIYIGDPMCSWCYGISSELESFKENLDNSITFETIVGGLRPHGTETMKELKSFLKHHWKEVQKKSGKGFSFGILDSAQWLYNSEPACRAVVTMKELSPKQVFSFFAQIQTGFYVENRNPEDPSTYKEQAAAFGIEKEQFAQKFMSEEMKAKTNSEFERARKYGVNSFPTVLVETNGKVKVLIQGYASADQMRKKLANILGE